MNAPLTRARNYVTVLGRVTSGLPREPEQTQLGTGNYVIMTEPLGANNIYNQFALTTTVDEIINVNVPKAARKAKS